MLIKSIRWRLQLWLAFLLICLLTGFGVTSYQLIRNNRLNQIDESLQRRVAALSADVRGLPPFGQPGRPPPFERDRMTNGFAPDHGGRPDRFWPEFGPPPQHGPKRGDRPPGWLDDFLDSREIRLSPQTLNLFSQTDTNDFYYAIWSRTGNLLRRSTNAPSDVSFPSRSDTLTGMHVRARENDREAFLFTEIGECVLAGRCITADLDAMRRFAWLLVLVGSAVLAVGLGGAGWLASRALRPVEHISTAASRISAGNLAERINVAETDSELGRLAGVLNSTFTRLETAFAQQKQFTADASHELRTPIAVIIAETQTALAHPRDAADYRETVEACLETAQQMRRLTQSLLELARYDAGQELMDRRRVDLAELTRSCVEFVQTLAHQRGIRIRCELSRAEVLGDPDRLGQVITNLLTNAIQYNKDQGEIQVTTGHKENVAVLTVTDTGQGIAPQDLPHVFERFYRADKSRAGANGRSGLGLAISKAIVDAHAGTIALTSHQGVGTTFTVTLPG